MSIGLNIRGVKEVEAALNKKIDAITRGVDKEMNAAVLTINAKQVQATPVDTGGLRGGNEFDINKPLDKKIYNRIEYAPYIEFGTGGLVTIPEGLAAEAAQFKGAGIRQVNIRAQPFFYWPAFQEWAKMIERIKKLIAK